MSSIPTNLEWIGLIQKHQFFRRLRVANCVVRGRIWPNFKLIQALIYVIITCKNENDPIKNNREKVSTPFFFQIITLSVAMETSGRILNSSKLSCMLSLPASMKRIRSRTAEKKWRHSFSHYKPMGIFFRRSRAANSAVDGPIRPKFDLV